MNRDSGNWRSNNAGPRQLNNDNANNSNDNIGARGRCDSHVNKSLAPVRSIPGHRGRLLKYQVVSPFILLRRIHNNIRITRSSPAIAGSNLAP